MSSYSKQNKMQFELDLLTLSQNLVCIKVEHQPNTLYGACLNKNCQLNRLFCILCEQDHILHTSDTFTFYQIQQSFSEHSRILSIYKQLDLLKNTFMESTNKLYQEICQIIDRYQQQSQFPSIKNFSYNQMRDYIDKLVVNIRELNSKIIFHDSLEILSNVKQNTQVILNRYINQMDEALFNISDTYFKNQQTSLIEQQIQKEMIHQMNNDYDFHQLKCNEPAHRHNNNNQILSLCLFQGCDQDKLICSKSSIHHSLPSLHRIYQIPIEQFNQSFKKSTIDEDQIKLIKSIQQQIRQSLREVEQNFQNLLTPHHHVKQIFSKMYNNGNKNDIVEEIKQLVSVDIKSGGLQYRLAELEYLKQYIKERLQKLTLNLKQICENFLNGIYQVQEQKIVEQGRFDD